MLKPLKNAVSDCINDQSSKDGYKIHKIGKKLNKIKNYEIFLKRAEMYVEHIGFGSLGMFDNYCG